MSLKNCKYAILMEDKEMKYCTKCVMPDTRPGIKFDENGVCSACQSFERRKEIDWEKRYQELENLCNKYRGMNGGGL